MSTKSSWVKAMSSIDRDSARDKFELVSPQIVVGGWCLCAEHSTGFKSIVMRWADKDRPPARRAKPINAVECPQSDRKKNWLYRVKMQPHELRDFVQTLI